MRKYMVGITVLSCLIVSNLMAISYDEALNLIKNKSFKVFHAPYGFDCKDANFSNEGIATNGSNTITLQNDGTLQDNQQGYLNGETINGFNWTIIDYDNNGFILSRTDGGESPASGIIVNTNATVENGAIEITPSGSGETYTSESHSQIVYNIGSYSVMKSSFISEENPYDQWAALDPNGYTSWYDYLTATNGKINNGDNEGLYDLTTMTQDFGFGPSAIIIDQNNTRLFVKSCTPMGGIREETYVLENNHIVSQMSDTSYFASKKQDSNTTQENNITTPPIQPNIDIYYPNGWSLSGVGKDENLSVSNIKCQNGSLTSMWKYKNSQWNLYIPSNMDYGYTTFDTLNNRDGFWVNCE